MFVTSRRASEARSWPALAVLIAGIGGTSACSALDDELDSCLSFESCNIATVDGGGGAEPPPPPTGDPDPAWACLFDNSLPPPARTAPAGTRVTYQVNIVDFSSQGSLIYPVPGLQISVCASPDCFPVLAAPTVTVTPPTPGEPNVAYSIEVPFNLQNAYLRLTAPDYTPVDYVFGGPMVGRPEGGYAVSGGALAILRASATASIYQNIGLPSVDPTRGVLAVRALNCLRTGENFTSTRAADVEIELLPENPGLPAVAWSLSRNNFATPNNLVTDGRGVAGFANLTPGVYQVRGIAPVGEGAIPGGRTPFGNGTVQVRANTITIVDVRPGTDNWGQ